MVGISFSIDSSFIWVSAIASRFFITICIKVGEGKTWIMVKEKPFPFKVSGCAEKLDLTKLIRSKPLIHSHLKEHRSG